MEARVPFGLRVGPETRVRLRVLRRAETADQVGKCLSARVLPSRRPDSALVVEHLTKHFGERVAFDDVSFEVGYGEVFGFLGPNGAGKTTTVRTLGTLIAPSSGSAVVAGIPLSARTVLRSGRGSRSCRNRRVCTYG